MRAGMGAWMGALEFGGRMPARANPPPSFLRCHPQAYGHKSSEIDMQKDVCVDVCVDMCIGMYIDVYIDVYIDMCIDM